MTEYGKRPTSTYQSQEYLVVNSGREKVTDVEAGGRDVHLASAGATIYDKSLAMEIKDKYRWNPNVMVIEKPWVRMSDGHKTHFTIPALPWRREEDEAEGQEDPGGHGVSPRVERADTEDGTLSSNGESGD
jgi:hypothetical protein